MHQLMPQIYDMPILIVDDDMLSRSIIERALKSRGFNNLHSVEGGSYAVKHLEQAVTPGLVILDIFMNDLNGFACCEWIRSQPRLSGLPVLMLTANTDYDLRVKAFGSGATDFVSKPIYPDELYARVKVHLFNRLSMQSLQEYRSRLAVELVSARDLQLAILPSRREVQDIQDHFHLDIAPYLKSSSELGGDFWGIKKHPSSNTAFWVADFSGHGVSAALNAFHLQAYLREHSELASNPGNYLTHINEKLLQLLPRGYFCTMFYGILDARSQRLFYASACSPNPLVLRKDGQVEGIDGSGTPLGVATDFYTTRQMELMPGDTILLYSDAMLETPNGKDEFIQEEDIVRFLASCRGEGAATIRDKLLSFFFAHAGGRMDDDLTFFVCRRME